MLREIHTSISRNFLKKKAYIFTWFKKWLFLCLLGMQLKEINKNTQMYLK